MTWLQEVDVEGDTSSTYIYIDMGMPSYEDKIRIINDFITLTLEQSQNEMHLKK